ncbi:hypothetical protein [Lactiplantibacillus plantarum]|uniref:hypothetical protein n=1 Tax=Lactiplantibacillus plantarum TaxID=1590 RepID=UPI003F53E2FC
MAESYYIDGQGYVRSVISIHDTAKNLRTSPDNIYTLIKLGLLRTLKLSKTQTVPLTEIQRFVDENLGKDLQEVIADEQQHRKMQAKVVSMKEG